MNEKNKKEWIKNVAIVFLVIMLLLTLFSNTIMNYSLPKVSVTYVGGGSINEVVRGSNVIEAGEPYVIKAEETRRIEAIPVAKGDHVEAGDVLIELADVESKELATAQDELAKAELDYYKTLLTTDVTAAVASSVNAKGASSFNTYVNQIGDIQNKIKACEELLKEKQQIIDNLSVGKLQDAVRQTTDKLSANLEVAIATEDKSQKSAELTAFKSSSIAEIDQRLSDLNSKLSAANGSATELDEVKKELKAIADGIGDSSSIDECKALKELEVIYHKYCDKNNTHNMVNDDGTIKSEYVYLNNAYLSAVERYKNAFDNNSASIKQQISELQDARNYFTNLSEGDDEAHVKAYEAAIERLRNASYNVEAIKARDDQVNAQYDAALKYAQEDYDKEKNRLSELKEAAKNLTTDISHALDADKLSQDIERKKEQIEKLKEQSVGAKITAPVAGIIQNIAYATGQDIESGKDIVTIIPDGQALTLRVAVKNEDAKRVSVGEAATLENSWIAMDAVIILQSITDDPDNPGKKSLLKFSIESNELRAGQSVTINMASISKECDAVVPLAAIHKDNSGDFVYVIEAKNSPLGNRYYAKKTPIRIELKDDTYAGVSGMSMGSQIITKSNKNVEDGKQVKLNEEEG